MHTMIKKDGAGNDSQIHNSYTDYSQENSDWLRLLNRMRKKKQNKNDDNMEEKKETIDERESIT